MRAPCPRLGWRLTPRLGLAVLGLALSTSACAPDGLRYTVVPRGEPAVTRPAVAAPAAPTGDRQLDAFLADFAASVDRKDWYEVARLLEGPTYADLHDAAVAAGDTPEAAAAALIAEALGLTSLGEPGPDPFSSLNRIQGVTLRTVTKLPNGVVRVQGDVRLGEDRRDVLTAFVRRAPDTKGFRIILSRA